VLAHPKIRQGEISEHPQIAATVNCEAPFKPWQWVLMLNLKLGSLKNFFASVPEHMCAIGSSL